MPLVTERCLWRLHFQARALPPLPTPAANLIAGPTQPGPIALSWYVDYTSIIAKITKLVPRVMWYVEVVGFPPGSKSRVVLYFKNKSQPLPITNVEVRAPLKSQPLPVPQRVTMPANR